MSDVYVIQTTMHEYVQLNIQFSQGNAATHLRCGDRFSSSFCCSLSENAAVKELLKLTDICQNYWKNKNIMFYGPQCRMERMLEAVCCTDRLE